MSAVVLGRLPVVARGAAIARQTTRQNATMPRHLLVAFLLGVLPSLHVASASELVTLVAAGRARSFYLYFEAQVDLTRKPNPMVEKGRVIAVDQKVSDGFKEFECTGDTDMTSQFMASGYGKGTEGTVLEFNCGSGHRFLFTMSPLLQAMDCGQNKMVGTKALAIAASFGHQAFCLEDWRGRKNAREEFLSLSKKPDH
ncbi:MAG TPA: hypothetical protein PLS22_05970 [Aquabacterium sp.]|nr:hypothetical protein [Aquabacterium sp.]